MSEGTKVTLSGLLLLAASLIGLYGLYAAVLTWNLVYPLLFMTASTGAAIVPGRHGLLREALGLALVLLAYLVGHLWYDRIWAPMDEAERTFIPLTIFAATAVTVIVRLMTTRIIVRRTEA